MGWAGRVGGQITTQREGRLWARASQTRSTAFEKPKSRTGGPRSHLLHGGRVECRGHIRLDREARDKVRGLPGWTRAEPGAGAGVLRWVSGPPMVFLVGEGAGGTGSITRTCNQDLSPALPQPCCTTWHDLTSEAPAVPFVRSAGWTVVRLTKQGLGEKEGWPGVRQRGACGVAGRVVQRCD